MIIIFNIILSASLVGNKFIQAMITRDNAWLSWKEIDWEFFAWCRVFFPSQVQPHTKLYYDQTNYSSIFCS